MIVFGNMKRAAGRHWIPLASLLVLSVAMTWPILAHINSAIPGWEGDNFYYLRSMWWMKHAVFDLGTSPLFDATAYFPFGYERSRGETTMANTVLGLPVTLLWGPVVSYNVILVFSFPATGWATYLWVHELTGRRTGAVVAGAMAAFLPMRFSHLPGHLPYMATYWVALSLFAVERFQNRPTTGRAVLFGGTIALVGLACWYYAYTLALMLPLYVLLRLGWRSPLWRDRTWWRGIAVAGVVAIVLMSPVLVPMLTLSGRGGLVRSLVEMDSWSLSPLDIVIPNLRHPWWGKAAAARFQIQNALWVERHITLGYAALALALVALFWRTHRRLVMALAGVWIAAYLIALGPTLHVNDRQVRIPVPDRTVGLVESTLGAFGSAVETDLEILRKDHTVPVLLPSFFMYFLLPFASSMRVMSRFILWTAFMTAALAGLGAIRLVDLGPAQWHRVWRVAVPAVLVALITFESMSVIQFIDTTPRAIDLYLRDQPNAVVVEMPLAQARRAAQDYYATVHQKATIFSWIGDSFPPETLREGEAALVSFPSASSLQYLKARGATHVVLAASTTPNFDAIVSALRESPLVQFDRMVEESAVFLIHPQAPRAR